MKPLVCLLWLSLDPGSSHAAVPLFWTDNAALPAALSRGGGSAADDSLGGACANPAAGPKGNKQLGIFGATQVSELLPFRHHIAGGELGLPGGFGASACLRYMSFGQVQALAPGPGYQDDGESLSEGNIWDAGLGLSRALGSRGAVGVRLRRMQVRWPNAAEQVSGFDLGALWEVATKRLVVGLAAGSFGSAAAPRWSQIGLHTSLGKLQVYLDLVRGAATGPVVRPRAGLELDLLNGVILRAGHDGSRGMGAEGLTVGIGVVPLQGALRLDYAVHDVMGSLPPVHTIGVGIRVGKEK